MSGKILMIDDDRRLCEELQETLEREGYHFSYCMTGIEGIALLEKDRFDLLILDLKLPDLHGMDILKKIKKIDTHPRVLVFTGSPLNCDMLKEKFVQEEELFRMADAVLNKPCKMAAMLARIKELIPP
ncbi:MAG: response regulator transcription factor [bacterium]